jgi:ACT domain-containing protein
MPFFLIALFGKDRPGIVAEVSKVLYHLNLNIEDSSMTRLKGEFTIMLIVSSPTERNEEDILSALEEVKDKLGLWVACKRLPEDWQEECERKRYTGS